MQGAFEKRMVSSGSNCVARKVGSQQEATSTIRISALAADLSKIYTFCRCFFSRETDPGDGAAAGTRFPLGGLPTRRRRAALRLRPPRSRRSAWGNGWLSQAPTRAARRRRRAIVGWTHSRASFPAVMRLPALRWAVAAQVWAGAAATRVRPRSRRSAWGAAAGWPTCRPSQRF